jgi:hypothetical protein
MRPAIKLTLEPENPITAKAIERLTKARKKVNQHTIQAKVDKAFPTSSKQKTDIELLQEIEQSPNYWTLLLFGAMFLLLIAAWYFGGK